MTTASAGRPTRASSEARRRQGLRADAAGREPRGADHAVLDLERRGDRDERELVGGAIAHLEIARARGISAVRHLDRDDQLAGLQRVLEVGRVARQPIEVLDREAPLAVRAAQDASTPSSATSATARSDGWVATQWSLVPRMAWPPLMPSIAAQPDPGSRLLQAASRLRK